MWSLDTQQEYESRAQYRRQISAIIKSFRDVTKGKLFPLESYRKMKKFIDDFPWAIDLNSGDDKALIKGVEKILKEYWHAVHNMDNSLITTENFFSHNILRQLAARFVELGVIDPLCNDYSVKNAYCEYQGIFESNDGFEIIPADPKSVFDIPRQYRFLTQNGYLYDCRDLIDNMNNGLLPDLQCPGYVLSMTDSVEVLKTAMCDSARSLQYFTKTLFEKLLDTKNIHLLGTLLENTDYQRSDDPTSTEKLIKSVLLDVIEYAKNDDNFVRYQASLVSIFKWLGNNKDTVIYAYNPQFDHVLKLAGFCGKSSRSQNNSPREMTPSGSSVSSIVASPRSQSGSPVYDNNSLANSRIRLYHHARQSRGQNQAGDVSNPSQHDKTNQRR